MDTKEILLEIRKKFQLTQEEMADRLCVTRQAVSRWEQGETVPSTDLLKLISKEFNVSINTLLGSPRQLICQCCGMPLYEDDVISRETDGSFNEEYCKWCYVDGKMVYHSLDELIDYLVPHMAEMHHMEEDKVRESLQTQLPTLNYWQNK